MSLVAQLVSRLDLHIDKRIVSLEQSKEDSNDARNIQGTARALSVDSHGLLTRHKLLGFLHKSQFSLTLAEEAIHDRTWLVVAKATTQTLGIVLNLLLENSSLIGAEIGYWDDVLGSSLQTGYYMLQTGPTRIWLGASNIFSNVRTACIQEKLTSLQGITGNWRLFYQTVRRNVQRGQSKQMRNALSSPFSLCRSNIRQKQQALKIQKKMYASAIGILLQECLTLASNEQVSDMPPIPHSQWCGRVYKVAMLMEIALHNLSEPLASSKNFEDEIFYAVDNKFQGKQPRFLDEPSIDVSDVMESLKCVLQSRIPCNAAFNNTLIKQQGRPSIFTRYWLPTALTLMSLTTSLRILTNRKAELITWVSEFGSTIIDFWGNWVLQPVQKLIGTIRHDEQSEIAIMSRNSLEADWRSLERMVVDFVSDHSQQTSGNLQEHVKSITTQVREGDLTPVLKAYERDLRKPFMGTVRGDLVRALLIQIQKTKVDVEVAIGGIDALLKSQELVFGFIGLTPGLLITYGAVRWIASLLDSRKGFRAGIEKQQFRRAVRNIDRILGAYPSTPNETLSYEDYGLCIYEAHILKQRAQYTLPRSVLPMFQQDLTDLTDLSHGVSRQQSVVHRIQWMYSRWI